MGTETLIDFISSYGYWIIFLFLFFGIVGIPAPEESLLFLIGVLIGNHKLAFGLSAFSAEMGALLGMLAAYWIGKNAGKPFLKKYGKFIGITEERWKKAEKSYLNDHRLMNFSRFLYAWHTPNKPVFCRDFKSSISSVLPLFPGGLSLLGGPHNRSRIFCRRPLSH
ncbi:hypothetical protein [Bacillus sp. ISL-47]|uniref:DedA family protein n=1 Tax=Bacillus sp. ISL-47 TaxID=2819130 RepID=UPI001BE7AA50|nr:hypothetical protein [Bacillus sp. ISL-47]MBT2706719.1 hypothetical protein [Pseudomonas sp. ISL-84]